MLKGPATAVMAAALAVLPAATADRAAGATAPSAPSDGTYRMTRSAEFAVAERQLAHSAVTYAPKAVPEGAGVTVRQRLDSDGMTVSLTVRGVAAGRTFGAHVHTRPCGPGPSDPGPHYQHVEDPVRPSGDPAYANPWNEVWLDLTTDARGTGTGTSRQSWWFRAGGARSVTLHQHATRTGRGEAGFAGERLACFSVPFLPRGR
ncbi:superoxide dismutase family protein [Streptomyces chumphonensis]|uniref:superoxide dismutase family protein n=1 Tax=Streptomyces chumphonensis TaxID=1214925 RepID=UPI003D714715